MYFAVQHGEEQFKLYQNTIYNLSVNFKINVLWPINNVDGLCQTIRLRDETQETSLSRSWNSRTHMHLKWTYTGSSIKILLKHSNTQIIAAVISMTRENIDHLPYCSSSFIPFQSIFAGEKDISYTLADVYSTDPNSFENTRAIPAVRSVPVASPMPQPVPMASPMPQPSSLPPHITKIVLADAIRKNEVCPITSEDITETNATVTSCGHVFTTAAIKHWLSLPSSRGLCPLCKQKC